MGVGHGSLLVTHSMTDILTHAKSYNVIQFTSRLHNHHHPRVFSSAGLMSTYPGCLRSALRNVKNFAENFSFCVSLIDPHANPAFRANFCCGVSEVVVRLAFCVFGVFVTAFGIVYS